MYIPVNDRLYISCLSRTPRVLEPLDTAILSRTSAYYLTPGEFILVNALDPLAREVYAHHGVVS